MGHGGLGEATRARGFSPKTPSWRTGAAQKQARLAAGFDILFFCSGQATFTERDGEGPWVTPTSAEEAHIAGIVRAPVSCGTPCAAGGSDPRIKWMFMYKRLAWT